ncbi:MAG: hypothetical protein GY799_31195 [Desulfobulbaceae bacterium]|nr:hypothetical protein [Desulfobulbaceae bacterium]
MFLKFFGKKSDNNDQSSASGGGLIHGIDREMNYCPSCGDEYRADISHCGACSILLISGREKLDRIIKAEEVLGERSMDISPDDELVNIRKGPLKDMKALQKLLAQNRVPAILAGDEGGCAKGCCGPELYLQIKKEDMVLATEVLAREFIKSTALDSHDLSNADAVFNHLDAETVCPACGCRFSPTVGACPECGLCFE